MGKASRNKRLTAQEKIAIQRAAQRKADRQRTMLVTGGAVVAVIAVVLAFVLVKTLSGSPTAAATVHGTKAEAVMQKLSTVPAATLDSVGAGSGQSNLPRPISGSPPLTENGKPEMLYVGAEFCPFCAAERWAMAMALSRFGTFSNVGLIHSSSTDVYPSTPTLTFYKSSYTSKYLTFTPVETETVTHASLQTPTSAQQALVDKYDAPPYTSLQNRGAIPFIDFGNKVALVGGSSYIPQALHGMSWDQVAAALSNPTSTVAKQVDGAANYLTASICKMTNDKPATVCATPAITALAAKL